MVEEGRHNCLHVTDVSTVDFLRLRDTMQTGEVGGSRLARPSVLSRGVRALGARRLTSLSFTSALTRPGPVGSGIADVGQADDPLGNTSVAPNPIEDLAGPQSGTGGDGSAMDGNDVGQQDQRSTRPSLSQVGSFRHGDSEPAPSTGLKPSGIASSVLVLCASTLSPHVWCQHEVLALRAQVLLVRCSSVIVLAICTLLAQEHLFRGCRK